MYKTQECSKAMPVIRNKILIIAILATGLFGRVPTTSAQFGGSAGFADAFRIEFLERDLPLFVETLQLEDWQRIDFGWTCHVLDDCAAAASFSISSPWCFLLCL